MNKRTYLAAALLVGVGLASQAVQAGEFHIGEPLEKNGMEIGAIYLQAVKMEPQEPQAAKMDIHLEADIHATKGNVNGFGAGEWIPYLQVAYEIKKVGTPWSTHGSFMPMVASDGPHYGANVALDGPGKYKVDYQIVPPIRNGMYRHTDKETGVGPWWAPFHAQWSFVYLGTGKKGGY